jgi:hypothetical protein
MRHEETRDNTTAIEATIIEADNRDMTPVDMDNPREGVFPAVVTREDAPAKILPVIVTVDKLPRLACDYPKPYNPQHVVDGVAVEVVEDDDPEDDGQPSEYEEWQDYMGGDDWDHGQFDDCGW